MPVWLVPCMRVVMDIDGRLDRLAGSMSEQGRDQVHQREPRGTRKRERRLVVLAEGTSLNDRLRYINVLRKISS